MVTIGQVLNVYFVNVNGIGHNLFVQPASRSLIVRPGSHVTLDVITYYCST